MSARDSNESWELKSNYIKNIDKRTESELKESLNKGTDYRVPDYALENTIGEALAALTSEDELNKKRQ